jgi:uncharacterized membrane protein YdfJ with MMPL/SSD domain
VLSNKLLLAGIAVALAFAAALVNLPALHGFFGTAALSPASSPPWLLTPSSCGARTRSAACSSAVVPPLRPSVTKHPALVLSGVVAGIFAWIGTLTQGSGLSFPTALDAGLALAAMILGDRSLRHRDLQGE